jgi:hypothetical protein
LKLNYNIVVKFYFTNPNRMPRWVVEKKHSQTEIDIRHAKEAERANMKDLAEIGRARAGRIDTGEQMIAEKSVTASGLHAALRVFGARLVDVHRYIQRKPGKMDKSVISLTYSTECEQGIRLSASQVFDLREIQSATWDHLNVWVNPDGVTTLNFLGLKPQEVAKKGFVPCPLVENMRGMFQIVDQAVSVGS